MYKVIVLILLLMLRTVLGQSFKHNYREGTLVKVSGSLSEEPQVTGNSQKIVIGQFEVRADRYPEYHYGDFLVIGGRINKLPLGYLLSQAKIESNQSKKNIRSIKGIAIAFKNNLLSIYKKIFPSPYDSLVSGIVLGDKSLISYDLWQSFKASGTLHIMVASGMNIAMFSGTVLSILIIFFKRKTAIAFLFMVIWFYALMTGLQPPIVRAAIMASLVYLSQLFGRQAEGSRVLWLTGYLMLLINPFWLLDLGFQLSFMATAGLVYLQPIISKSKFFLFKNESFSSSIAAQLSTLPILVINFGTLNLLSPLINLAVLWTIPLILQGGIMVGMIGLFWDKLARFLSYILYPLLFYLEKIVDLSSKIIVTQIYFPRISWFLALGYYLVLAFWIKKLNKSSNPLYG